jgi:hypothetical protein
MTRMTRIPRLSSRRARVATALTSVLTAALTATALAMTASTASAASDVLLVGGNPGHTNEGFTCATATHGINPSIWPIEQVQNGCGTRVWLHNESGGAYCFSPHTNSSVPQGAAYAINALVSATTSDC